MNSTFFLVFSVGFLALAASMPSGMEDKERKLTITIVHDEEGDCGCNGTDPDPWQPATTLTPTTTWPTVTTMSPSQCPIEQCCSFECPAVVAGDVCIPGNISPTGIPYCQSGAIGQYCNDFTMSSQCYGMGCQFDSCGQNYCTTQGLPNHCSPIFNNAVPATGK